MILVDSCVLIDIIEQDAQWLQWSMSQVERRRRSGDLKANIVIYAELAKSVVACDELDELMGDLGISVQHISHMAAHQAAQAPPSLSAKPRGDDVYLAGFLHRCPSTGHGLANADS